MFFDELFSLGVTATVTNAMSNRSDGSFFVGASPNFGSCLSIDFFCVFFGLFLRKANPTGHRNEGDGRFFVEIIIFIHFAFLRLSRCALQKYIASENRVTEGAHDGKISQRFVEAVSALVLSVRISESWWNLAKNKVDSVLVALKSTLIRSSKRRCE